jgi:hypothetical protein
MPSRVKRRPPRTRDELVQELLRMRFPKGHAARGLLQEKLEDELDESDVADVFDEENWERRVEQRIQEIAEADWDEASGLSKEQHGGLRDALRGEREAAQMPLAKLRAEYEEETEKAAASEDPEEPFARFHREGAIADFNWWAKTDVWTLQEGVLVVLGRDPRQVRAATLDEWRGKSKFVGRFDELLDLARRAKDAGILQERTVPSAFVEWAERRLTYDEAEAIAPLRQALSTTWQGSGSTNELAAEIADILHSNEQLSQELEEMKGNPKPTFYKLVYLFAAANQESFTRDQIPKKVNWLLQKVAEHEFLQADDQSVRKALTEAIEYVERVAERRKRLKKSGR